MAERPAPILEPLGEVEILCPNLIAQFNEAGYPGPLAAQVFSTLLHAPVSGCTIDSLVETQGGSRQTYSALLHSLLGNGFVDLRLQRGYPKAWRLLPKTRRQLEQMKPVPRPISGIVLQALYERLPCRQDALVLRAQIMSRIRKQVDCCPFDFILDALPGVSHRTIRQALQQLCDAELVAQIPEGEGYRHHADGKMYPIPASEGCTYCLWGPESIFDCVRRPCAEAPIARTPDSDQSLAIVLLDALEHHFKRRGVRLQGETAEMFVALVSPKIRDLVALVQELEGG
jgi:DNA-binding transcriptional ArsR family regulator